jgi:cation:H+ antiporter
MTAFLLIILGVVLLYLGGEVLVESVTRMAAAFRVAPMIIGLTVVAFGTSSPEVAVAVGAGLANEPDIALGNVLGSNIANLSLILGISALVRPVEAHRNFMRRDLPFLFAISVLLLPAAWLLGFTRGLGVALVLLLCSYLWVLLRGGSGLDLDDDLRKEPLEADRPVALLGVIVGIAFLVFGADVLVDSAVEVATRFGVSERVIGLTLVAFGTSLPELAGCLAAAKHGEGDIVLGNVTGSNIFNTLLVLPAAILIRPVSADMGDFIDIAVMIAFTALTLGFFLLRGRLGKAGGVLLLATYGLYVAYLFVAG